MILQERTARRPIAAMFLLRQAWSFNATLTIFVIVSVFMLLAGIIGLLVDPRIVLGMPNWTKSAKFGVSMLLYGITLLWLLPMITRWPRLAQFIGHASGAILIFEIVLIALQAVRGVPMHFNGATPFDAAVANMAGLAIVFFWLATVVGLGLLLFQPMPNRVLAWGVRLGMIVTLVGFTQGFLMSVPNATQMALFEAGQQLDMIGAHTVGALDGGPGLPLLGWSTEHGDLRIGHFVGIHGIQAVALLAFLLVQLTAAWVRQGHKLALVSIGALSYLGLIILVTWQALRDQPLLAPDALTLAVAGTMLAASALLAGIVLLHARHSAGSLSHL